MYYQHTWINLVTVLALARVHFNKASAEHYRLLVVCSVSVSSASADMITTDKLRRRFHRFVCLHESSLQPPHARHARGGPTQRDSSAGQADATQTDDDIFWAWVPSQKQTECRRASSRHGSEPPAEAKGSERDSGAAEGKVSQKKRLDMICLAAGCSCSNSTSS